MLKTILIVIALAIAAVLIYAATKPDSFSLQRSALIAAPADKIFPLINDMRAFNTWNPFAKEDPYTELDCAVARIDFNDGKATLAPVLVQTRKVTVTADGTVDLDTEALALDFNTRPRSGIGISPGMFTNPFLELRGTLLKPTVRVGAKGVTSGALAAATGGATVVAKGLVDRVKGEVDLCQKVLEEARQPAKAG